MSLLAAALGFVLASPDRSVEFRLSPDGARYSVYRKGEEIVSPSPLGLEIAKTGPYAALAPVRVRRETHRRRLPLIATKADATLDAYNGLVATYREASGLHRQVTLEVRAYNDGVAFRYRLPAGAAYEVKGEATAFLFPNDADCEVSEYSPPHESTWSSHRISQLDTKKLYDMPAACASRSGRTHFAIAQSDLTGYAGGGLEPVAGGLHVRLTPLPDDPALAVRSADGLSSAWRVILMGDRAGDLIPSEMIGNLAPQPQGDFSWVKPGKAAWDWWSGPTAGEKPSMGRYERFIDFAAGSGFPYFLIDAGWAYGAGPCCAADPKTDITRPDPAIDMPALVQYAAARHVSLVLWVHWEHIAKRIDEVLDTYQRWGIAGVKVDFTQRDDQEMVKFYHQLARATARRRMLLDMHGAYPPEGLQRAYPNYITQEGVLGAEYNKFSDRVTPGHNVRLAYTRMLLGPMDYTPGGFRNGTPRTFAVHEVMPTTQTTRGQALAMYVVYESPLQMVSDDPTAYADAGGFEFLKAVPTAWDETRFLGGTPETYVAVARRKGRTWYIGAMTNEDGRKIELPLSFLGEGGYSARSWVDGADPNAVVETVSRVSANDRLSLSLAPAGGAAVILTPRGR